MTLPRIRGVDARIEPVAGGRIILDTATIVNGTAIGEGRTDTKVPGGTKGPFQCCMKSPVPLRSATGRWMINRAAVSRFDTDSHRNGNVRNTPTGSLPRKRSERVDTFPGGETHY